MRRDLTASARGNTAGPRITPKSPHSRRDLVGTTFFSSHTMMEARKQGGLIASSEARIVESRQASNRLFCETQSAARRRIRRPQNKPTKQKRCGDERFGRSPMSPATTGGWTTSSTAVPEIRDVDLTSESLASGVRDPAFGRTSKGGARRLSKAAPGNSPRRVVMSNASDFGWANLKRSCYGTIQSRIAQRFANSGAFIETHASAIRMSIRDSREVSAAVVEHLPASSRLRPVACHEQGPGRRSGR